MLSNRAPLGLVATLLSLVLAGCSQGPDGVDDGCDGGCFDPPEARCDGDVLVSFGFAGQCVAQSCEYPEERQTCPDGCADGACTGAVDPCRGVTCDSPDPPSCEGTVAITWEAPGECVDGACSYQRSERECADRDRVCRAGECVDPCRGVTCDAPPGPRCEDAVVIVSLAGECVGGGCVFEERRTDCSGPRGDGTCVGGACVEPDRCAGVVCEPPPPFCDAEGRAVTPRSECVASTGECRATQRAESCGDGQRCRDGVCEADPCAGVVCDTPPPGTCEGFVATPILPEGVCDEGVCNYAAGEAIDCAGSGLFCAHGVCVSDDPCDGVVCTPPEARTCDGNTSVELTRGRCVGAGECAFTEVRVSCTASRQVCVAGDCVDPTLDCETLCSPSPAAVCEGDVAVSFSLPSSCETGCAHPRSETDCRASGRYCSAGECVVTDPCVGTVCESPPGPRCDGEVVVRSQPTGVCGAGGVCTYGELRSDCAAGGGRCSEGACVFPDPCDLVRCDTPPADRCDGASLLRHPETGSCSAGRCTYAPERVDCASALPQGYCSTGQCRSADPCYGVACDAPPAPFCDGLTVVSFGSPGACVRGECGYPVAGEENCGEIPGGVCVDAACSSLDPCWEVVCDTPPGPVCRGNSVVRFSGPGVCSGGLCDWQETREPCVGSLCSGGACGGVGPCAGVVCAAPPPSVCEGDTLVWYGNGGTCADGFCSYPENRANCRDQGAFCSDGACVPQDPCTGVTCETPPAATCSGDSVVRYVPPGRCSGGRCGWGTQVENCAGELATCVDGACATLHPCDGVSCDAVPAPACDGAVAVTYAPPGVCDAGWCRFDETRRDCSSEGRFCFEGACQDLDPCDTVRCNEPPFGRCDGDVLVESGFPGTCEAGGVCTYAERRTDCTASDRVCREGACVVDTICLGVECSRPEQRFCEDRVAVRVTGDGVCTAGTCSWERTSTDCAATGRYCRDGSCVDDDPCIGVDCTAVLYPRCDGNTALTYPGGGECSAGVCIDAPVAVDCGATGRFCSDGECVVDDPCTGVTCVRPGPVCAGLTAITYSGEGVCTLGSCQFQRTLTDCAAQGRVCEAGACVDGDVCAYLECTIPPARTCDGDVRVEFGPPASCEEGSCAWTETRTDCTELDRFCLNGRCVGFDPCAGVVCDTVPPPECDAGVAVTWSGGRCAAGVCGYDAARRDCRAEGLFCDGGACVANDPCVGVSCDAPPPPICAGSDVIEFVTPSECVDGDCVWSTRFSPCSDLGETCFEGECVPDRCVDVVCLRPPAPTCDGDVAVVPGPEPCVNGECVYPLQRINCRSFGFQCVGGACLPADPCDLVVCDDPPEPHCLGSEILAVSEDFGTCVGGTCVYEPAWQFCADTGQVCIFDACVPDPCDTTACDDPPAPYCNGTTVYRHDAIGACSLGTCLHGATPATDCAGTGQLCEGGVCVTPDSCTGVLCTTPPPVGCVDRFRAFYSGTGVCVDGACDYDPLLFDCGARGLWCRGGACVDTDPCVGVDCTGATPEPYCVRNTLVTPSGAPRCSAGECVFDSRVLTDCAAGGQYCVDGACVDDNPCDGVVCSSPPPGLCDGLDAISFSAPGHCSYGECLYRASRERCPDSAMCTGDDCESLCELGSCPARPARCEANVAVSGGFAGQCDPFDGSCSYPGEIRTDCSPSLVCQRGACRDPATLLAPGDLTFSELMITPASGLPDGQWIELHNRKAVPVPLDGTVVRNVGTGQSFAMPLGAFVPADGFLVLVSQLGAAGGAGVWWGGPGVFTLPTAGELVLVSDGAVIARIVYPVGFGARAGVAAQLDEAHYDDGGNAAHWCDATSAYAASSFGTPGADNFGCP